VPYANAPMEEYYASDGGEGEAVALEAAAAAASEGREAPLSEFQQLRLQTSRRRRQRQEATEVLLAALESRQPKELKDAIALGTECHEGETTDGKPWRAEELRAAIKVHAEAIAHEERKKLADKETKKLLQVLNDFVIKHTAQPTREEPLGVDKGGRAYWAFVHDPARVYVQAFEPRHEDGGALGTYRMPRKRKGANGGGDSGSSSLQRTASTGGWTWAYYDTVASVKEVLGSLDDSSEPERSLEQRLRERLPLVEESMQTENVVNEDEGWRDEGHAWMGIEMMRKDDDKGWVSSCKVTRWLPGVAGVAADSRTGEGFVEAEKALFHVVHEDGDEEDLDEDEAMAARSLYLEQQAKGALPPPLELADKYLNKAVKKDLRITPESLGVLGLREEVLCLEESIYGGLCRYYSPWGTSEGGRASWLLSARSSTSVNELAQLVLSLEVTVRDLQGLPEPHERKPWRKEGNLHIGKSARRFFASLATGGATHGFSDGKIVGWLPPEGKDEALWHMVHGEDADEEDLDETEVAFAIANHADGRLEPLAEEVEYLAQFEPHLTKEGEDDEEGDEDIEMHDDDGADDDWNPELKNPLYQPERATRGSDRLSVPCVTPGQKVKKALWITAECRERWLAVLQTPTPSVASVGTAVVALRQHCKAFGLIHEPRAAKLTRDDFELQLHSWCHANAFGAKAKGKVKGVQKKAPLPRGKGGRRL